MMRSLASRLDMISPLRCRRANGMSAPRRAANAPAMRRRRAASVGRDAVDQPAVEVDDVQLAVVRLPEARDAQVGVEQLARLTPARAVVLERPDASRAEVRVEIGADESRDGGAAVDVAARHRVALAVVVFRDRIDQAGGV